MMLPFFAAWSSQFSKVHGPQAPHGDTSQSMGQGIWQSWDVLGTAPWHSLFSTGREAVQMSQNKKQIKRTCFTLILFWFVFIYFLLFFYFYRCYNQGEQGTPHLLLFQAVESL